MNLPTVDKTYELAANEGSSQIAQSLYIIAHDTGNDNDNGKDSASNEASFMKRNFGSAYTHYIAGWDRIYLIGTPGYVAWGALGGNPYSPLQIELSHYADHDLAIKAYRNWVNTMRYYSTVYGIPLALDAGGTGTPGVKSHKWISEHLGGDHVDPYGYLSQIGISQAQFASDLKNGFSAAQPPLPGQLVAKITYQASAVRLLNKSGKFIDRYLQPNTSWIVVDSRTINGECMLQVATNMYLPLRYTDLQTITINYVPGYGVNAVNSKGKQVIGSNQVLKDGTCWKVVDLSKINGMWAFLVGKDEYVLQQYIK